MKVNSINSSCDPGFGHSFRVSICLKSPNGLEDTFVNPHTNKKLYQTLNSNIVAWLNEDYRANLRKVLGIERKLNKRTPSSTLHTQMINELKALDNDYARLGIVRSVYNGKKLGYIATGIDVPIIENIKGTKNIGVAKADSRWYSGTSSSDYVKQLTRLIRDNALDYVKNANVLLRSKNNKEIMLKTIFKEVGKTKKGSPIYELDKYEFHENKTLPTLPKISSSFILYKYNPAMDAEIKKTVQYLADKIAGKRVHFSNIEKFLNSQS